MKTYQQQWFGNIRGDLLSGIVVALALIPEALAFAIIAGVDPMVSLYASFSIAVIVAIFGGRPAMISAATGAMALVIMPLMKEYGLNYLLATTILTGIIQMIFGILKIAKLLRFIPNAVMIGFVNALAILMFMAQVPQILGDGMMTYIFVGVTLLIVYVVPRFLKAIPAPLIAIVVLTGIAMTNGFELKTVGDLGTISNHLPSFFLPQIPLTFETIRIILPYSVALAIVGLLESLMTATILDEMTDTKSDKNKEARGQGLANFITGFFGGMAGCAMIGQSVINVRSGGRGRLSTFMAGAFLMFLIIVLGDLVVQIPMAVLVGIMIAVCNSTFDWGSFKYMITAPKADVFVMLITIATVVWTHNLAIGVILGVFISAISFVAKISKINVSIKENVYFLEGPLFFASTDRFLKALEDVDSSKIILDFSNSHLWDESAVGSLIKVIAKLEAQGTEVEVRGLNTLSTKLYTQYLE